VEDGRYKEKKAERGRRQMGDREKKTRDIEI
jgi:hypothetical protein